MKTVIGQYLAFLRLFFQNVVLFPSFGYPCDFMEHFVAGLDAAFPESSCCCHSCISSFTRAYDRAAHEQKVLDRQPILKKLKKVAYNSACTDCRNRVLQAFRQLFSQFGNTSSSSDHTDQENQILYQALEFSSLLKDISKDESRNFLKQGKVFWELLESAVMTKRPDWKQDWQGANDCIELLTFWMQYYFSKKTDYDIELALENFNNCLAFLDERIKVMTPSLEKILEQIGDADLITAYPAYKAKRERESNPEVQDI